jgi:hypothetical protein
MSPALHITCCLRSPCKWFVLAVADRGIYRHGLRPYFGSRGPGSYPGKETKPFLRLRNVFTNTNCDYGEFYMGMKLGL